MQVCESSKTKKKIQQGDIFLLRIIETKIQNS